MSYEIRMSGTHGTVLARTPDLGLRVIAGVTLDDQHATFSRKVHTDTVRHDQGYTPIVERSETRFPLSSLDSIRAAHEWLERISR